jgi:hypothetical protein
LGSLCISFATLRDLLLVEGGETKSGTATTAFGFSTTMEVDVKIKKKVPEKRLQTYNLAVQ